MNKIISNQFELFIHSINLLFLLLSVILVIIYFDKIKKIDPDKWVYLFLISSVAVSSFFIALKSYD